MSKDQGSKDESVQQLDEENEKPGSSRDTSDLVDITIITNHGQSVVVQYESDGMPYRSSIDPNDLIDGQCPQERLQDAPYGIDWQFDFADLARRTELELKKRGIWTYADLESSRKIIRIATTSLTPAIWDAAKRGCNRRP